MTVARCLAVALCVVCASVVCTSCDGEGCLDICDTHLNVEIEGVSPDASPIGIRVCDGSYCQTFSLVYGECKFEEPTREPGFRACFVDGRLNARRFFVVTRDFLPIPNDPVEVVVTDAMGTELVNATRTPVYVDTRSCIEECTAREVVF